MLNRVQDFDLGTVMLGTGAFSGDDGTAVADGVLTCPAPLTCSGARQVAIYNVSGSNNTTVRITTPDVMLVNQSDPTRTLRLTVDSPGTVAFTNSAPRGVDFQLGGSITLDSTVTPGHLPGHVQRHRRLLTDCRRAGCDAGAREGPRQPALQPRL